MNEAKKAAPVVENREAKIVMKGNRQIRHDLFKLAPAKMTKNNGWKQGLPILVHHEHTHIFHSRSEKTGKVNVHCSPAGGHFHEVVVDWTKTVKKTVELDGVMQEIESPMVKCGPALCIHRAMVDGVEIKEIVPPSIAVDTRSPAFAHLKNAVDNPGKDGQLVDRHTHDVIYLQSEYFTMGERNEFRKHNRQEVQNAMSGPASQQIMAAAQLAANAAKGKEIADGKAAPPPKQEGDEK